MTSNGPKKSIGPSMPVTIQLGWLFTLIAVIITVATGYAALCNHDHDEEYMPREVLEQRLDTLTATAGRIEARLEELRHGDP